ncbi:MAG: VWA domain-containing protein [Pseudomonadota bacterium]
MSAAERWYNASLAGALALIGGPRLGGVRLMASAGPVRQVWLDEFNKLMPVGSDPVFVPASVSLRRLTGGVSMAKSLASGELAYESGLIDNAAGRALIVSMADRMESETGALMAAEIEKCDAPGTRPLCTVLLDESESLDDAPPGVLIERMAFPVDLTALPIRVAEPFAIVRDDIDAAKDMLPRVTVDTIYVEAVVAACLAAGALSIRTPIFCIEAAKAIAALHGRLDVSADDVSLACRLVVPGRSSMPEPPAPPDTPPPEQEDKQTEDASSEHADNAEEQMASAEDLETLLIEAVMAEAGANLARRRKMRAERKSKGMAGRSGNVTFALDKGRPDRAFQRRTDRGRVDLIATLRTAAPMQPLRGPTETGGRIAIRRSDLRMKRFRRRQQSSVIFVVDASGSSALNRLSEAKGAATQLLSDCYARRDLVSVITFRGKEAELALPPTRSLVRARRQLSDLPGGGATPLADAVALASSLAHAERDRGRTPIIVFLSDGRGNMALDGTPDRSTATEQTKLLARRLAQTETDVLFFDISKRPDPRAQALSADMRAEYYFLPIADRTKVSGIVRDQIGRR